MWTRGIPVGIATASVINAQCVSCITTQEVSQSSIRNRRDRSNSARARSTYQEQPIKILDQKERATRRCSVKSYKVQWSNHSEEEATWETEDYLRAHYLEFLPSH